MKPKKKKEKAVPIRRSSKQRKAENNEIRNREKKEGKKE